jgi:hypothetical protein
LQFLERRSLEAAFARQRWPAAAFPSIGRREPPDVDIAVLNNLVVTQCDECHNNRWWFRFCDDDIILRNKAAKVLAWLDKFKQVGNVAVNFDPQHAALPWAGMRLFREISHEHIRSSDLYFLLEGQGSEMAVLFIERGG